MEKALEDEVVGEVVPWFIKREQLDSFVEDFNASIEESQTRIWYLLMETHLS